MSWVCGLKTWQAVAVFAGAIGFLVLIFAAISQESQRRCYEVTVQGEQYLECCHRATHIRGDMIQVCMVQFPVRDAIVRRIPSETGYEENF